MASCGWFAHDKNKQRSTTLELNLVHVSSLDKQLVITNTGLVIL